MSNEQLSETQKEIEKRMNEKMKTKPYIEAAAELDMLMQDLDITPSDDRLTVFDLFEYPFEDDIAEFMLKKIPVAKNEIVKSALITAASSSKKSPKGMTAILIDEFLSAKCEIEKRMKWEIAEIIYRKAKAAKADDIERIRGIVADKKHGRNREMLVLFLGKVKDEASKNTLIKLLDDEDVNGHAVSALGTLKASEAKAEISKFLTHKTTWKRNKAKTALAKIEKFEQKNARKNG